jgi:hypothetical protein
LECGGVSGGQTTVYIKGMGGKYKGIRWKDTFRFSIFWNLKILWWVFGAQKVLLGVTRELGGIVRYRFIEFLKSFIPYSTMIPSKLIYFSTFFYFKINYCDTTFNKQFFS